MRKGRLLFWIISLVICAIIIFMYKKKENSIPYEEKTPINVYCLEDFQEEIKEIIEKSFMGETHRVVFTDSKEEVEFILTDKITTTDIGYERVGWTPLIIAFDVTTEDKIKSYEKDGYLVESNYSYKINFEKIIEATLAQEWTDKIYCPRLSTREGELFFDFLLININSGVYPKSEEELEECTKKANEFLNSNVVVQGDATERLENKKIVENELYIIFEKDIYDMQSNDYEFEISYPTNTVLYEIYYYSKGDNAKEIKEVVERKNNFLGNHSKLQNIMYKNYIRYARGTSAETSIFYKTSDGFSYVENPLKEE